MSQLIIRPATAADIEAFSTMTDTPSIRGYVGEIDGRIIGMGGLAFARGWWFAFCNLTEEARAHKMAIMRTAKRILAEARRDGIRFVYVERDPQEPRADVWLASLGFHLDPRSQHYFRWDAKDEWQH